MIITVYLKEGSGSSRVGQDLGSGVNSQNLVEEGCGNKTHAYTWTVFRAGAYCANENGII